MEVISENIEKIRSKRLVDGETERALSHLQLEEMKEKRVHGKRKIEEPRAK